MYMKNSKMFKCQAWRKGVQWIKSDEELIWVRSRRAGEELSKRFRVTSNFLAFLE